MPDINSGKYKVSKSGAVRQAGVIPSGDGSTGRGATARAGTLANSKGGDGGGPARWRGSFSEGGLGKMPQKFRPTTKGGKISGGK